MLSGLQGSYELVFGSGGQSIYINRNILIIYYQFCWENGGYLAEFSSSQEEARVNDILATDLEYWIGLTDFATEGKYKEGKAK